MTEPKNARHESRHSLVKSRLAMRVVAGEKCDWANQNPGT